ncbi:MAG TPA: Sec-independent protein translocase subunit TatA [Microbacterium sp.]|nr:Sec-independent protein translocase subunit TatA [Microbacterium sp.]
MAGLTGWHLLIILAVILLLFGAAKLPALAKSMGQSARVFKGEMSAMKDEDAARKSESTAAEPETPSSATTTDNGAASGTDRTP